MDSLPEKISDCIATLESLVEDRGLLTHVQEETRKQLLTLAGRLARPNRLELKRMTKEFHRQRRRLVDEQNRAGRAATGIRAARTTEIFAAPARTLVLPDTAPALLAKALICYVCKERYTELHFFYDTMCPTCAEHNYRMRFLTADLSGRVALVTGGRVKIGYHTALKLLRAGAQVYVTTRFPHDAAKRYAAESDYGEWNTRLKIFGLDLRHSPSVEMFTRYLTQTLHRLDILINNAAQTVRRPAAYYEHLLAFEDAPLQALPAHVQPLLTLHHEVATQHRLGAALSTTFADNDRLAAELFPTGRLDCDLQQVDLRPMNSWRLRLADVPTAELLEVHLINAVGPFILCGKLKPLMERTPGDKFIVNASAMEGKFSRHVKTDKHPHTNMAKASLNMMTLTSAPDYAMASIFMNAVDTGWVTDEDPAAIAARKQAESDFQPPLDIVDGAARLVEPIFSGVISGRPIYGKFLKDYHSTSW